MGIEEEIEKLLRQGHSPQQLIQMGYRKSTVYKVYRSIKTYIAEVSKPEWCITDIKFNPEGPRYLPGENISLSFNFQNTSNMDIYLYRIGLWIEWLKPNEWYVQDVRELVKPGQKRFFSFSIQVPENIVLGEYELKFGVEKQYLPIAGYQGQSLSTEWSEPIIIHIKYPLKGVKVFVSHSVHDIHLVRQLAQQLDNYGFEPIIAEDIQEPGVQLMEKFREKIREATIFLVIFTDQSVRSKWVIEETNYARQIGKPIIPLKEESLKIELDIEWIEFSRYEKPEIFASKIINAIESRLRNIPQVTPFVFILAALFLGFFGGYFMGSTKKDKK